MSGNKKITTFIIPFAFLSSLSVSYFPSYISLLSSFFYLHLKTIFFSSVYLPVIIGPGIFFSLGIYLFAKKNTNKLLNSKFILLSTSAYIVGYSICYFLSSIFPIGIITLPLGGIIGASLFCRAFSTYVTALPSKTNMDIVVITLVSMLAMAIAGRQLDLILPAYTMMGGFSPSVFGTATYGAPLIIFIWQIVTAWKVGSYLNTYSSNVTTTAVNQNI